MVPPSKPIVTNVATAPTSAVISWMVPHIFYTQESYLVQYGITMTRLNNTSKVVPGNTDLYAVDEVFSVNITGLTPFTKYYFVVLANNTIGNTSSDLSSFIANEKGMIVCVRMYTWTVDNCWFMYVHM